MKEELRKVLAKADECLKDAIIEVSKDDARQTVDDAIKFLKVIKKLF